MPGGNFDYELKVQPNGAVAARGPLEIGVSDVKAMCVWVFQKIDDVDAIASAMGPPQAGGLQVFNLRTANAHWEFTLQRKYGSVPFVAGSATAMGIGAFVDDKTPSHLATYWWSEAVTLELVKAAQVATA